MSEQGDPQVNENPWLAIARSPFHGVYVYELHWLAADVVRRTDLVFEHAQPAKAGTDYLKVDSRLHAEIYALLGSAAKIRALIEQRPKRRQQSQEEHQTLVHRTNAMRELLDGIDLEVVLSPAARNSVEHFDERLDQTALAAHHGTIQLPVHMPVDMTVWSRAAFEVLKGRHQPRPDLYPLRVYVASERVFLNAGEEIDIGRLRDECGEIAARLSSLVPRSDDDRGAFVLVLTPDSFASS